MKGLIKIGWILLLLLAGWQVGVAQDDTANDDFADPWDPWEEGEYDIPAPIVHDTVYCLHSPAVPLTELVEIYQDDPNLVYELVWRTELGGEGSTEVPDVSDITSNPGKSTFYVSQRIVELGYEGPQQAIDIEVFKIVEPYVKETNIETCKGEAVFLTALKNEDGEYVRADDEFVWYTEFEQGGSSTPPIPDVSAGGVTSYYVHQKYTLLSGVVCLGDVSIKIDVTVHDVETPPAGVVQFVVADGVSIAGSQAEQFPSIVGIGKYEEEEAGDYEYFYAEGTDATTKPDLSAFSTTKPAPVYDKDQLNGGTKTLYYWVYRKNKTTGCPSEPSLITVNISDAMPPKVKDYYVCQGEAVPDLVAEIQPLGNAPVSQYSLIWYGTDPTSAGTLDDGSCKYTSGQTSATAGVTTYYVAQKDNNTGAVSAAMPIKVTILANPITLATPPAAVCETEVDLATTWSVTNVTDALTTGYLNGTTELASSKVTESGTYTITNKYVNDYSNIGAISVTPQSDPGYCVGTPVNVTVTIDTLSTPLIFGSLTACPGIQEELTTFAISNVENISYSWDGANIATGDKIMGGTTNSTRGQTFTYTVTATAGTCSKTSSPHTLIVSDGPVLGLMSATETDNSLSQFKFTDDNGGAERVVYACGNELTLDVNYDNTNSAAGTEFTWYDGSTLIGTGASIQIPATTTPASKIYEVKYFNECAASAKVTVHFVPLGIDPTLAVTQMTLYEGELFNLEFDHNSSPILQPEIKWFKDGMDIVYESDNQLVIPNITSEDNGKYGFEISFMGCKKSVTLCDLTVLPVEQTNSLWTDIVTSRPDSYVETTGSDGKTTITLKDEKALAWLASVAAGYNGATQSSFENTEVVLDANVDMSAHVWSGIKEFYGSLHGQGNSIIGLRINDDTPNGFSLIDTLRKEGEIKDLRLEDVSIDVNAEVGVASFVSWNFGVLKNCSCDGFVQAYYPAGGLVGHNSGEILSCKNSATVAAVGSVGGIANYNYNLIADCVNEGTLSSGNGCGGICNLLGNGEIRNSINKGSVSGKSTSGGVVALCTGSETAILNSCNVANVTVPSGISSFALSGFEGNGVDCSILNCYSSISQPLYSTDDNYDGNVKAQYIYFPSSNTTDKESNEDYIASFSPAEGSDGNDWTLSYEVFGTTDLVEALNAWVAEQDDDIYSSWAVDEDMENGGYPILTFKPWEELPEVEQKNSLWTDIVTSRPDSYVETTDADGKTIITLKDEEALAWLASVAAGYNGATQSSFENTEVVLSASVNMSAYVWSCIPNFNGYFNGNKKSVTGLRIANNTPNGFAMISTLGEKGEIRNLNLKETELKLTEVKGYIASLVKENKGFIQGCSNEGNLSVISDNRGVHLGGLVSLNYGSIINCSNRGIVSFDCSTCINNIDYQSTAGVAAYPQMGSIISDCINFATISGCSCTGGIAGLGSGVIRNSGNRGDIYGGGSYVGGVSGVFAGDGAMENCYNTGNVKGSAAVGSLIGYQGSSTVVNCYSASKRPIRGAKEGTTSLSYIYWNSDSLTANESKANFLLSFKEAEYSQGYDWTLSSEVLGTTDLLTALNNWVIQQDTSIYSGWKAANVQINKGYPILEFGYDPFNQYDTLRVDTLLILCTKTQYGGKQYTINDEGTVQPVVIGNKYYTNPTLHIKDPDFSKVKVHRPSLICASDTIKLYAEGAESYCWRYGVDTLSVSDGVELVLNEDRRIQLVTEIDGCYRTYNTDVKLNQDSVLIEMGGWGDVIAIKNPNSLFSSYQWYRDGELLEDEMGQFYYEPQGLTPGLYSVDIIDTSGNLVPICPLLIVREEAKSSSQSISLYPNPVRAMQPFYVEVMASDLDKAVMTVSDESGVEILRREPVAKLNELRLPSGYYVVTVYLSDKKIVSDKILIE
ncbi:MAG: hypothetical protein E7072_10050 [Bacteroidales bacterium]|nr:hypothetical protein [Bacteroidales bacterium]